MKQLVSMLSAMSGSIKDAQVSVLCQFLQPIEVRKMDHPAINAAILFVDLLALVNPGSNFVLVSSTAVSQSRTHAIWTAAGIAAGSFAWAVAALGIVSVFEVFPLLSFLLKVVGVAYLIYLGITLLRSKGFKPTPGRHSKTLVGIKGSWRGFMANITNPKSAAF